MANLQLGGRPPLTSQQGHRQVMRPPQVHPPISVHISIPNDELPITVFEKSVTVHGTIMVLGELIQQDRLKERVAKERAGATPPRSKRNSVSRFAPNPASTLKTCWWWRGLWTQPRKLWPALSSMLLRVRSDVDEES